MIKEVNRDRSRCPLSLSLILMLAGELFKGGGLTNLFSTPRLLYEKRGLFQANPMRRSLEQFFLSGYRKSRPERTRSVPLPSPYPSP